jgi:predicted amidohydrolase YtcJ
VVLDADPFEVDPGQIKEIPVDMTVIGGGIVLGGSRRRTG